MKVLVVGGGGREHALAWKLRVGARLSKTVLCAPGNPGTAAIARNVDVGVERSQPRWQRSPNVKRRSHRRRSRTAARSRASSICFGREGCGSSAPSAPRHSSNAARCSRRTSWRGMAFRRRAIVPATRLRTLTRSSRRASWDFPSSSRRTVLPRAKGVVVAPDRASADLAIRAAMEDRQFGERRLARRARGVSRRSGSVVLCDL